MMTLLDPLPKETIFSIAARYHLLSGYLRYQTTSKILFGSGKVRIHPYLPAHITSLSHVLQLCPSALLTEHTLYCLFSACLPSKEVFLKQYMLANDGGKAVHAAGLANFHLKFVVGHRFCPSCVRDDEKAFGIGFYHVEHQVPGVSACYRHGVRLQVVQSGDFGIDRKLFLPPSNVLSERAPSIDIQFAAYVAKAMSAISAGFRPTKSTYLHQLVSMGMAYESGRIKETFFRENLADFFCGANWLCDEQTDAKIRGFKFIGSMLRTKTYFESHPFTHLLLGFWLSSNSHELANSSCDTGGVYNISITSNAEVESAYVLGISVGLPHCYVANVLDFSAKKTEFEAPYCHDLKLNVFLSLALVGVHREQLAAWLNRSISQVEMDISNVAGLSCWRRKLKVFIKTNASRIALADFIEGNRNCSRQDVKKTMSNDFFQLYRYDRVALERLLPEPKKRHDPHIDWVLRDLQVLKRLRRFSKKELNDMSYSRIDVLLGGHGWLTKKRKLFPESTKFIQSAKQLELA